MTTITIELTSEDAEEIIVALAMRRQQVGLRLYQQTEIERIGDALAEAMAPVYGWEPGPGLNLFRAHLLEPRRVRVL